MCQALCYILNVHSRFIVTCAMKTGSIVIPTLWMKDLRLSTFVGLDQGLTVSKQQSWDSRPWTLLNGKMELK